MDNYVRSGELTSIEVTGWETEILEAYLDVDGVEVIFVGGEIPKIQFYDMKWAVTSPRATTIETIQQYFDTFAAIAIEVAGGSASSGYDGAELDEAGWLHYLVTQELIRLPDDFRKEKEVERDEIMSQFKPRPGYIYLVQAVTPNTLYKIGYSVNPISRIESMGVKLPFPIKPIHIIPTNDTRAAEQFLHNRFATKRLNGEWFNLSSDDIYRIRCTHHLYIEGVQS